MEWVRVMLYVFLLLASLCATIASACWVVVLGITGSVHPLLAVPVALFLVVCGSTGLAYLTSPDGIRRLL